MVREFYAQSKTGFRRHIVLLMLRRLSLAFGDYAVVWLTEEALVRKRRQAGGRIFFSLGRW